MFEEEFHARVWLSRAVLFLVFEPVSIGPETWEGAASKLYSGDRYTVSSISLDLTGMKQLENSCGMRLPLITPRFHAAGTTTLDINIPLLSLSHEGGVDVRLGGPVSGYGGVPDADELHQEQGARAAREGHDRLRGGG